VGFHLWIQGPEESSGNYVKTAYELLSHGRSREMAHILNWQPEKQRLLPPGVGVLLTGL
jgi:hypothetical protein